MLVVAWCCLGRGGRAGRGGGGGGLGGGFGRCREAGDVFQELAQGGEFACEAEALVAAGAGAEVGVGDQELALAGGQFVQGDDAAVGMDVVGDIGEGDGHEVAQAGAHDFLAGLFAQPVLFAFPGPVRCEGRVAQADGLGEDGGDVGFAREARADHAGVARAVAGAAGGMGGVAIGQVFGDEAGLEPGEGAHPPSVRGRGRRCNFTGEAWL
jgi:hypothetical protein